MRSLRLIATGAVALAASTASANDKPKIYPRFESHYIKRIAQPQINSGACFGYYPTQWKSFNEACGQPEVVYSNAPTTPETKKTPEVTPPPKTPTPVPTTPMNPTTPPKTPDPVPLPVDPKPIDPKPIDPKKPGESGKSSQAPAPLPAKTVSITLPVPQGSTLPPIPLVPVIPDVNVK